MFQSYKGNKAFCLWYSHLTATHSNSIHVANSILYDVYIHINYLLTAYLSQEQGGGVVPCSGSGKFT